MITELPHEDVKYITVGNMVITLKKEEHGFWSDPAGTIYAFYYPDLSKDPISRCGVYPWALPTWPFFVKVNERCAPHDFAYSSDVYQAFHMRSEADEYLRKIQYPIIGEIFEWISRLFGKDKWENKDTND